MKKLYSTLITLFLIIAVGAQNLTPYEEIANRALQNQKSIINPIYKIPNATAKPSSYLQSAITVGEGVYNPIAYFSTEAPSKGYINFSREIAIVEKGKSFNLILTANKHETINSANVYIFTDWDRDGSFSALSESIQITDRNSNPTPGKVINISVPDDAESGKTRIRILLTEESLSSPSAEANLSNGYIYDLILFIQDNKEKDGVLISTSSNNPKWGISLILSDVTPSHDGYYPLGTEITFKAITKDISTFKGWSDGTQIVSQNKEFNYTVGDTKFLIAVFEQPVATLEAPQVSTADNPIWYQIKNAQIDTRLDTYIAYTPNGNPNIHIKKPVDFTDKFLWRLEESTNGMVKIINKGSEIQIYSDGANGTTIIPATIGSDFFVTPSGNTNGSYSIQYNKNSTKLLNGDPQSRLLLYNGGVGTGSGWYFYKVPAEVFTANKNIKSSEVNIFIKNKYIQINGCEHGDQISIFDYMGHQLASVVANSNSYHLPFSQKGIFIITISTSSQYKHIQKIAK